MPNYLNYQEKRKVKIATAVIAIGAYVEQLEEKKRNRKQRSRWSRQWLLRRKQQGCYENLMRELALEVNVYFYVFSLI